MKDKLVLILLAFVLLGSCSDNSIAKNKESKSSTVVLRPIEEKLSEVFPSHKVVIRYQGSNEFKCDFPQITPNTHNLNLRLKLPSEEALDSVSFIRLMVSKIVSVEKIPPSDDDLSDDSPKYQALETIERLQYIDSLYVPISTISSFSFPNFFFAEGLFENGVYEIECGIISERSINNDTIYFFSEAKRYDLEVE